MQKTVVIHIKFLLYASPRHDMLSTDIPPTAQRGAYRLLIYDAKNKATQL